MKRITEKVEYDSGSIVGQPQSIICNYEQDYQCQFSFEKSIMILKRK